MFDPLICIRIRSFSDNAKLSWVSDVLQEKQQAVEEAAQAALEASSAAEAQHAAASRQLATDKRNLQAQKDQVSSCLPACLPACLSLLQLTTHLRMSGM